MSARFIEFEKSDADCCGDEQYGRRLTFHQNKYYICHNTHCSHSFWGSQGLWLISCKEM